MHIKLLTKKFCYEPRISFGKEEEEEKIVDELFPKQDGIGWIQETISKQNIKLFNKEKLFKAADNIRNKKNSGTRWCRFRNNQESNKNRA